MSAATPSSSSSTSTLAHPHTTMGSIDALSPSLTDDVEVILLGTGTSSTVPHVDCLTAPPGAKKCKTCWSTLYPEGKKNIRVRILFLCGSAPPHRLDADSAGSHHDSAIPPPSPESARRTASSCEYPSSPFSGPPAFQVGDVRRRRQVCVCADCSESGPPRTGTRSARGG